MDLKDWSGSTNLSIQKKTVLFQLHSIFSATGRAQYPFAEPAEELSLCISSPPLENSLLQTCLLAVIQQQCVTSGSLASYLNH